MKAVAKLVLAAGIGFLLVGGQAMAQDNAVDPWSVSATLGSQFSDNRDGSDTNKESNVDVFLTPRADLRWRQGERTLLDVFVMPSVKWHSNPRSEESGNAQNDAELFGAAGVDFAHRIVPRLGIKAGDTLNYTDDPEVTQSGATVRQSASHWLNNTYGGLDVAITEKINGLVNGSMTTKRYTDEAVADDQDEDTYRGDTSLKYKMGLGYSLFGIIGITDFNAQSSGVGERDRGSQILAYGAGVERVFSPDVSGRIQAGYQTADFDDESVDSEDTFNGSLELLFRAASPTRFRIGAAYGYYEPNVRPYSIQTLKAVSGAVEHDILPDRLVLTLNGQYSEGEYDRVSDDLPGGTDKLGTIGISGRYIINRNWSVRTGYTFEKWDSDVRESFDRNLVDVGVTARL